MRNNSQSDRQQTGVRQTESGMFDAKYPYLHAQAGRNSLTRHVISCVMNCGQRTWSRIKKEMKGRSVQQQLSALSDRDLKDIGLVRNDIEKVANGSYATDQTRCACNRGRLK